MDWSGWRLTDLHSVLNMSRDDCDLKTPCQAFDQSHVGSTFHNEAETMRIAMRSYGLGHLISPCLAGGKVMVLPPAAYLIEDLVQGFEMTFEVKLTCDCLCAFSQLAVNFGVLQ